MQFAFFLNSSCFKADARADSARIREMKAPEQALLFCTVIFCLSLFTTVIYCYILLLFEQPIRYRQKEYPHAASDYPLFHDPDL